MTLFSPSGTPFSSFSPPILNCFTALLCYRQEKMSGEPCLLKEEQKRDDWKLQCCLCMQNIPICFCALSWGEGSRKRAPSLSPDKGRLDSCAPTTKDSLSCQLCLLSVVSDLCATLVANTYAYQTILIGFLHNVSARAFFFFLKQLN